MNMDNELGINEDRMESRRHFVKRDYAFRQCYDVIERHLAGQYLGDIKNHFGLTDRDLYIKIGKNVSRAMIYETFHESGIKLQAYNEIEVMRDQIKSDTLLDQTRAASMEGGE